MRTKKENTGPSLTVVLLIGLATLVLGKFLALASLVSQPVTSHGKMPEPDDLPPGEVFQLKGQRAGRTAWLAKEQAWRAGELDILILSEAELNQWSESRLAPPRKTSSTPAPGFWDVELSAVGFRIENDVLHMAAEVRLPGMFSEKSFLYQVSGNFERTRGGIRFVPRGGTLGQAPLGHLPVGGDWLWSMILRQYEQKDGLEWLVESMDSMASAQLAQGQLTLRRQGVE